ncbi:MAG: hypothetical protein IK113_05155 [Bacteroidales bacterium]|nr:hypothetical protein [Bacteroidales bacterium]
MIIRDARPEDAPFLAKCIMSGMHLYDFEKYPSDHLAGILSGLTASETLEDGIRKGLSLGFNRVALVADPEYSHLVSLYKSLGFAPDGTRHAFGTDFLRMVLEARDNQRR